MKICIICRKPKKKFSDEHVIPESIKGYYHIWSVCKSCNSKLGNTVDSKLVNHKFIEFERHRLNIKGKKGNIPNPFSGTHIMEKDSNQKVKVTFDKNGQLNLKLLPKIRKEIDIKSGKDSISITIDAQEIHLKDKIIDKILKRNGIDKSQVNFGEFKERTERPRIKTQMSIDIKDFRIGLLKIAYEFTVDSFPSYFNDESAELISKILLSGNVKKMDEEVAFIGNGLDKSILEPLTHLIDFDNDNHYIVLMEINSIGLLCQVNLFNTIAIGILMSKNTVYLGDDILLGVNDITNSSFEKLSLDDIISRSFSQLEYRFQYWLPNEKAMYKLLDLEKHIDFEYYQENGKTPFFNFNGEIIYSDIELKLKQKNVKKIAKGDINSEIITQYVLEEDVYIKLMPSMDLYKVESVQIERSRKNKI